MNTKNIFSDLFYIALTGCLALSGCKDTVELPSQPIDSYTKLYMPGAVNGVIARTFKIIDSPQTITYGADYGGYGYPSSDIPVNFSVDNSLIDSFNLANKTNYAPLPDSSYTLSAINSVIPKGQLSTAPLSVTFKTKGDGSMNALKLYVLPITLTCKSVNVNPSLSTTFFVVKAQPDLKDYPDFDRSQWKILGFSSQEASGEGPNNGRAIFCLDGDPSTYWHTQWQNGQPGPPHWLLIDMGQETTLHGLAFLDRQSDNAGKPNEVNVQVSVDSTTWTDAGTFNLQNIKDLQPVFLPNGFQPARYFKVIVNSSYNATYTHLAELNAF